MVVLVLPVFAEKRPISGIVVDEQGEPVIGASVIFAIVLLNIEPKPSTV